MRFFDKNIDVALYYPEGQYHTTVTASEFKVTDKLVVLHMPWDGQTRGILHGKWIMQFADLQVVGTCRENCIMTENGNGVMQYTFALKSSSVQDRKGLLNEFEREVVAKWCDELGEPEKAKALRQGV